MKYKANRAGNRTLDITKSKLEKYKSQSATQFFRFGIDELDLPSRLFETDFEPTGKKRVNNYFQYYGRWI